MRIAMGIEYDGSGFRGWQRQSHDRNTIQQAVEEALSRVANHPVEVICAGRTDAGVHASGQVIHFDTHAQRDARAWTFGTTTNLPKSVAALWAIPVPEAFHARFSAQRRAYRYVIFTRDMRPTFLARRVSWNHRPLDLARMQAAAQALLGEHDFTAYRTVACQAKSPVRTIHQLELSQQGPYIFMDIEANGFLHHMVRNIAGVLMAIGAGDHPVEWSGEVLAGRDRTQGGVTAPAGGLYLSRVSYPDEFAIPSLSPPAPVW